MRVSLLGFIAGLMPLLSLAGPVDINQADAGTLATELNGVGLSKAQAIVDYRERNGQFTIADQLLNVKGIGPQVLESNRENIQLKSK